MGKIKELYNWYINTPWHQWWVEKVWKPSWTNFISWVYGLPAAFIAMADKIGSWAGDNTIKNYLAEMNIPNWVPTALAVIAILHYIGHGRSED